MVMDSWRVDVLEVQLRKMQSRYLKKLRPKKGNEEHCSFVYYLNPVVQLAKKRCMSVW